VGKRDKKRVKGASLGGIFFAEKVDETKEELSTFP